MVFVDFSKAFDTVGRTGLWQLLRKYGCPEKFTTMIEALHTGMMANISVGGEVSESFSVTNGAKQGCLLGPTPFSIFLSAMLDEAFRDMGDGVYIQSRQSADLFNVAHFRAKTKTTQILMRELIFADDSALVGCTLCWRDAENSGCFLRYVKEVWLEDLHQEDRGAVPIQLYKNPRGGYHGWWKQSELCSRIHLPRNYYIKWWIHWRRNT